MTDLDTDVLIAELKGCPMPKTLDVLAMFFVEVLRPMADELKALRTLKARIDALEGSGIRFCGTHDRERKDYRKGDVVISKGSSWIAQKESPMFYPGDGPDWALMARAGRDGKDVR